jgi:demethylmenaquinone methyltransferase / 2-methoxy-6-polyprenyl-1,4-benzoquinol methylase
MPSSSSPNTEQPVRDPHPVLREYYSDATGKRRFLERLFEATAGDYDRIDKVVAFGTGPGYRRDALVRAGLKPGMLTLDVAVGTGLVAREASRIVGERGAVIGVDPSPAMIAASPLHGVKLVRGIGEALPFPDRTFDFLSLGFALRHLDDLEAVFREFRRVLKPGGRLVLLEISRPEGRVTHALVKLYLRAIVPAIVPLIARRPDTVLLARYFWDTIEACTPPERIMATLVTVGFSEVDRVVKMRTFSEYRGTA